MTDIEIRPDGTVVPTPGAIIPNQIMVAHHIAPLVVMLVYGGLFVWYMVYTTLWFVHLPVAAQTGFVTGWIGGTQTMMAGLAGLVFKLYTDH